MFKYITIIFGLWSSLWAIPHHHGVFYKEPYKFSYQEDLQSYKGVAFFKAKEQWWHFLDDEAYDVWISEHEIKLIDRELKQVHLYAWNDFKEKDPLFTDFHSFWFETVDYAPTNLPTIVKKDRQIQFSWKHDKKTAVLVLEPFNSNQDQLESFFSIPNDYTYVRHEAYDLH